MYIGLNNNAIIKLFCVQISVFASLTAPFMLATSMCSEIFNYL